MKRWALAVLTAFSITVVAEAHADSRRLTYGTIVDGTFDASDENGRFYSDLYIFEGAAGDRVHLAAGSAEATIRIWVMHGDDVLLAPEGRFLTGEVLLPADGTYTLIIQGSPHGSGRAPLAYSLAIGSKPVADDVKFLTQSRGFTFHSAIHFAFGAGLGGETKIFQGVGFVLAPGYQLSPRFGIDLLVSTSIGIWPAENFTNMSAGAAFLVGPRLRLGSKYTGFIAVTPGVAHLLEITEEDPAENIDTNGLGLRLDFGLDVRQWRTSSPLVYLQTQRHGELTFYLGGFGVNF